jgi:hypothetical protein
VIHKTPKFVKVEEAFVKNNRCFWCSSTGLRRMRRSGFLRRVILPLFGYYPWECMSCRRILYLKDDGHLTGMTGV